MSDSGGLRWALSPDDQAENKNPHSSKNLTYSRSAKPTPLIGDKVLKVHLQEMRNGVS